MPSTLTEKTPLITDEYLNGRFDALIGLAPKSTQWGQYFSGYLAGLAETVHTPF